MKYEITLEETTLGRYNLNTPPQIIKTKTLYGWAISDYSHEWEIYISWTTRQDGKANAIVVLTRVDDKVKSIEGLIPTGDICSWVKETLYDITRLWVNPINNEWGGE